MSHETTEVRLEHEPSLVTWYGDIASGIAPINRDPGGSGGTNMSDMHCVRSPRGRAFLARPSPQNHASRERRRAGIADALMPAMRAVPCGLTLCALLSFCLMPEAAETGLRLDGPRAQGGLLRGCVPPGSTVEYEGDVVRVSQDGWFLVGFGRDAPPDAELVVVSPDGR